MRDGYETSNAKKTASGLCRHADPEAGAHQPAASFPVSRCYCAVPKASGEFFGLALVPFLEDDIPVEIAGEVHIVVWMLPVVYASMQILSR